MNTGTRIMDNGKAKGRSFLILFLLVCLAGVAISIELTRIHFLTHTDPAYNSICSLNEKVNCKTVARSPFSVFAGLPVSVWGILGYLFMAVLAAWGASKKRLHDTWPLGGFVLLTLLFACASSILAYISFTHIDSICVFCTALYVLNFSLLVLAVISSSKLKTNPVILLANDFKAILKRPGILAIVASVPIAVTVGLLIFVQPYWHHLGWTELPDLPKGQDENGCHWIGAEDPLITVVEFSDYQCPHCRRAHKEMRHQASKYPDKVRLIHSHFPLPFHKRASEFSKAAECAALQGKFWDMNDALFSIQNKVRAENVDVESLAVQLGLDRSSFNDCMSKEGIPDCIREDMENAKRLKIPGTPMFYIDSQAYTGGIPPKALENAIKRAQEDHKKHQ